MRKCFFLVPVVMVTALVGCASMKRDAEFAAQAKAQPFSQIFPAYSYRLHFPSLENAYSWVKRAESKFSATSKKTKAAGLSAKLIGPPMPEAADEVIIYYQMWAGDDKGTFDLKNADNLENLLASSVSAELVIWVFCQDRAASISNFHLAQGYTYTSNSQVPGITVEGVDYKAEYPVGWGADKAFSYLRKEID